MAMKVLTLMGLLVLVTCVTIYAQDFIIGGWCFDNAYHDSIFFSARDCRLNTIQFNTRGRADSMQSRLGLVGELGMKAILQFASAMNNIDRRHNLTRFAGGQSRRYEAENADWFGSEVGELSGTWRRCSVGVAVRGLMLDGRRGRIRNVDSKLPCYGPSAASILDTVTQYQVFFRLKVIKNNWENDTVCTISAVRCTLDGVGVDSVYKVLMADDFINNVWELDTLLYIRKYGQSRWYAYNIYWYGKKTLYIDYVLVQDAVYDSLRRGEFDKYIHNDQNSGIIDIYSGPLAPNKDIVLMYYLWDEPDINQYEAYSIVDGRLKSAIPNNPVSGLALLYPHPANSVWSSFMATAQPNEFFTEAYPFGWNTPDSLRNHCPRDSGQRFQQVLDDYLCRILGQARLHSKISGKDFWVSIQAQEWRGQLNQDTIGVYRKPTPRELRCQVQLALAYGAKGIFYYRFVNGWEGTFWDPMAKYDPQDKISKYTNGRYDNWIGYGLVDESGKPNDMILFNTVKSLNEELRIIGPVIMNLYSDTVFVRNVPAKHIIKSISDSLIQCGLFHHKDNTNDRYFYLANRHCLPKDTISLTITLNYTTPAGYDQYYVVDLKNGQAISGLLNSGVDSVIALRLAPGDGSLYRLIPIKGSLNLKMDKGLQQFQVLQPEQQHDPAGQSGS